MIRIDEIYENTFLPWVRKNIPDSAIFYCDPFGRSDPDSILCRGTDNANEKNSIFFFDQEPVQVTTHIPTFDRFIMTTGFTDPKHRFLVCSETNSDNVDYICQRFNLRPFYYFFHGWAALDWFRGYDRTFLIPPLAQRQIKKTFFSPNRIIGGERKHRVMALYNMAIRNLLDNHISAPAVCPVENQSIQEIAEYFKHYWPNPETGIVNTISSMDLPRLFPSEETQRMSSCWLDQFDLCAESMIYHVSETVFFGRRQHLTEKTFKPFLSSQIPVFYTCPGHLPYLKDLGFEVMENIIPGGYDHLLADERIQKIIWLIKQGKNYIQDFYAQHVREIQHNLDKQCLK
jgi:hypothetical protein